VETFHGTTIVTVRRGDKVVVGGDGQVTLGNTVMKGNAIKVRQIYSQIRSWWVLLVPPLMPLRCLNALKVMLERYSGQLMRAAVEMAKDWRTDRMLRKLEAMMIVANQEASLIISGTGDVIDTDNDLLAIGSGGAYAQAAAQALFDNTDFSARDVVEKSLNIAGNICIYTNQNLTIEEITY